MSTNLVACITFYLLYFLHHSNLYLALFAYRADLVKNLGFFCPIFTYNFAFFFSQNNLTGQIALFQYLVCQT